MPMANAKIMVQKPQKNAILMKILLNACLDRDYVKNMIYAQILYQQIIIKYAYPVVVAASL